ncbi:hypothetical protein ACLJJ6_00115 [Pediococcus siamensis]|uniref:hypothetical protein n=1 Tax=Pediococcus siamensis TaxID=381829 RepID=UPI00399F02A9
MKKQKRFILMGCSLIFSLGLLSLSGATNQEAKVAHAVTTPASKGIEAPQKVDGTNTAAKTVTGNSTSGKVTYTNGSSSTTTATYQQNKYQNSTQAKNTFATKQRVTETNGTKLKLSDGTTATRQGVMGHVYIQWQKNGWHVTAVANTDDLTTTSVNKTNKAATAVANKVQQSLKNNQVTTQKVTQGNAVIYAANQQKPVNDITWQENKTVVQVSGTNATTTAKIAQETLK